MATALALVAAAGATGLGVSAAHAAGPIEGVPIAQGPIAVAAR